MAGRVPCGPLFAARGRHGRPRCVLLRMKRQAAEGLPSSAAAAAPSPDGEGRGCAIRDPAGPVRKQRLPGLYGPSGLHEAKDSERIARRK
nr:MAG TPA: hypothetical protein [Caudoviricetes sp.]